MCGIFGWTLNAGVERPKSMRVILASLAMANESRGSHSWGYWADGVVSKGLDRITMAPRRDLAAMSKATRLMAHTRYATTGHVTVANCHPFTFGSVTGSHNGMVYNHGRLNASLGRKMTVDSEHIFAHIAEGRKLSEIEAYGAIQYVDTNDDGTIWAGRFNGGELAIAMNESGMFWSSDSHHLRAALRLARLRCTMMDVREGYLHEVKGDGQLWRHGRLDFAKRPSLFADWPAAREVGTRYRDAQFDFPDDYVEDEDMAKELEEFQVADEEFYRLTR